MRELLPDIFSWGWFSEPHGYDFHGTLVLHKDGNLCIDPVEADEEVLDRLAKEGVSRILITNRNHSRAANKVREATGARTAIHPLDADHASAQGCIVDEGMEHGELIGPLVVVGVPGKSPGEVALHWPARRVLVVGDVVIGNPAGACGLLREAVMDDPAGLKASVRKLLELDFDTLLVGDGEAILEGAKQRLEELVESFPE